MLFYDEPWPHLVLAAVSADGAVAWPGNGSSEWVKKQVANDTVAGSVLNTELKPSEQGGRIR